MTPGAPEPLTPLRDDLQTPELIAALVRPDLRGRSPYGAPQLPVPVALNTNENSFALPPPVVEDIADTVRALAPSLNRYPDREFTALREDLSDYLAHATGHRLRAEHMWAANGSNEVLLHLLQAFGGPGRSALGFTPSYSMHPIIARTTGTTWVDGHRGRPPSAAGPCDAAVGTESVTERPGSSTQFDLHLDDVVAQVHRHRPHLVFLCSPNNPTGTALDLDVVRAVYDAAPQAVVIVDEAYAEFARAGTPSAVTLLPGRPRLVVSRTMSKAFALAGARVGYVAADPHLVDALRLVRMPYHLSAITQATARAALRHAQVLLSTVETIKAQRDRIVGELSSLGLEPVPSDANFVLFGGLQDAPAWWQELLDAGVLVRDVGLPGFLRVTAGTPQECTTFLDAIAQVADQRRHRGAQLTPTPAVAEEPT